MDSRCESAPWGGAHEKQRPTEAWSGHSRSNAPVSQQARQQYLREQIQTLKEAALANRRRADQTEGVEHEAAYMAWTDIRLHLARLLAELRLA